MWKLQLVINNRQHYHIWYEMGIKKTATILFCAVALVCNVATAEEEVKVKRISFTLWKEILRQEAVEEGIKPETYDRAMGRAEFIQKIIDLDRKQPDGTITFAAYKKRVVTDRRERKGNRLRIEYKDTLRKVEERYGVQRRFIVALWGLETDFGGYTGGFYVPSALATLAYDGRRSNYFKKELLNALKIIEKEKIDIANMKGSWAGAMGQSQFMPSTFIDHAVDFDGDGKRDIWKSRYDTFASIANYLKNLGWKNDQTWGRIVKLPKGYDKEQSGTKITKKMTEWQALGIRRIDGRDLPKRNLDASLIIPNKTTDEAYLAYDNYKKLLNWNRSHYFALTVGLLSDALR